MMNFLHERIGGGREDRKRVSHCVFLFPDFPNSGQGHYSFAFEVNSERGFSFAFLLPFNKAGKQYDAAAFQGGVAVKFTGKKRFRFGIDGAQFRFEFSFPGRDCSWV